MIDKKEREIITSEKDMYVMLDGLLEPRGDKWWDRFYEDRKKPIPFFIPGPDENLAVYVEGGKIPPGRVLDVGCGKARNGLYLAEKGFDVSGVDFSRESLQWAQEEAEKRDLSISLECCSIFDYAWGESSFDLVYDSGCLHHLPPHRRTQYLSLVHNSLKEDGYFSLVCFNEKGGAALSDYDVYRKCTMGGGLAYSEKRLRSILEPNFEIIEIRTMKEVQGEELFGRDFLWCVLMKKSNRTRGGFVYA